MYAADDKVGTRPVSFSGTGVPANQKETNRNILSIYACDAGAAAATRWKEGKEGKRCLSCQNVSPHSTSDGSDI